MSYAEFPYETLRQLGASLTDLGTQVAAKEHGAASCDGLRGDGQNKIQNAIEHFRDEWKTSVKNLTEDIGNWGTLTTSIAEAASQTDLGIAAALNAADSSAQ